MTIHQNVWVMLCRVSCCGVVVSMPVWQVEDPGSNPGSSETFTGDNDVAKYDQPSYRMMCNQVYVR